jgi:hypothetical protein
MLMLGVILRLIALAVGLRAMIVVVMGILILCFPDLWQWILGIGLIVVGILTILKRMLRI